ncbi:hypothetical protein K8352_00065 [Flavobacteriaceae bacterium F89]|uniref:Uncharacterized protein n=1 Tax=Cerina litoralis TaxID=2874477 RepID=A0AAE3JMU3_9FLAO|nr:hypothetical protein [Cerina litoralis]MCG2459134.1 hypothetical protein [Cerina litoralis]
MAKDLQPQTPPPTDEVDLGQLFRMIGNGFRNLFNAFLRVFLYFKRNILILAGLVIAGFIIGLVLKSLSSQSLKTEVIVEPNLDSKSYLYDIVDEIEANIKAKDTAFFKPLGIDVAHLDGFHVEIEPVSGIGGQGNSEIDMKYLELLEKFQENSYVQQVIKEEISKKTTLSHRITFYYKEAATGHDYAEKLMTYINSNPFYKNLTSIYRENAEDRIKENTALIKQVDTLIANYSKKIGETSSGGMGENKIVLDNKESLNVTGLFELKNELIRTTEAKKVELLKQDQIVTIINFGQTQEVNKVFFTKDYVLIPLIFVGLFFLWSLLIYLNGKAKELD